MHVKIKLNMICVEINGGDTPLNPRISGAGEKKRKISEL